MSREPHRDVTLYAHIPTLLLANGVLSEFLTGHQVGIAKLPNFNQIALSYSQLFTLLQIS